MALPEVIEIIPPSEPVRAEITVPGSKSLTNRALILAALATGRTVLRGALWSEDTQVMVACLQRLGIVVTVVPDPLEPSNCTIAVEGQGGRLGRGGSAEVPLELFVGNAGTAARFLTALACLGQGTYRLSGVPRMHERPQRALFQALRQLGYQLESPNDKLPVRVQGGGPRLGQCLVSIAESSQFASALLLCASTGRWDVQVEGENAEESPYVRMTMELVRAFPQRGGEWRIEPDASSGSYFWAAGWLLTGMHGLRGTGSIPRPTDPAWDRTSSNPEFRPPEERGDEAPTDAADVAAFPTLRTSSPPMTSMDFLGTSLVTVRHWPTSDWQIDTAFPRYWPLPSEISRRRHLGDSIMTAIVLAAGLPFSGPRAYRFTDLGRLRLQECERVKALHTELTRCGTSVVEDADTLTVNSLPSPLHAAEIETYDDHRMAMCFATLSLVVPGMRLRRPVCVRKTFPNFFQKLAMRPPEGLGIEIRDAQTGRSLTAAALFAD